MRRLRQFFPILRWGPQYDRRDLRSDVAAGVTVAAMLVPQAMAYALLAGLPPEVGLYAATVPVLVYALFGSSRQLAVGPVAIVSLLTATALAPIVDEGTTGYLEAAALLALLVGAIHVVLGAGRLGFLVNFLSHSVLVGFTAAAAIIIGFSQVKHLLGISIPRTEHFHENVVEVAQGLPDTHLTTLAIGAGALACLLVLKRLAPRLPGALAVVMASILIVELFELQAHGVKTVGEIPDSMPAFGIPSLDGSLIGRLLPTALVITIVGFMESIAVAKVYARRNRYDVEPNAELIGLGASNLASGMFGGYPVTGGFSRTAVNAAAGARTPLASIVTAVLVLVTIAVFTPLLSSLPNAVLGAIIVVAVIGLVDIREMRHISKVKPTDLISLSVAFVGTLVLGIELGIAVAVVTSMLVVFARMSNPHTAVLGQVEGTTNYRNVVRFPEVTIRDGIRIIRIDAAISFVNAIAVKRLIIREADALVVSPRALVLDASGINDLDATGADMLSELLPELEQRGVHWYLTDVKGPVRDVLRRAGLWDRWAGRIHASTSDAVASVIAGRAAPLDQRREGIDERPSTLPDSETSLV